MFTAVVSEVPVVVIDHGDARAHEAGDGEDGDAGAEREGGVGAAEIIEVAQRRSQPLSERASQWRRP
jgi:hypothetical protein